MDFGGNKVWCLKNFHFFNEIPPERVDEVAGKTHMKDYSKGHILFNEGDNVDQIYMLKQGEIILFHERNGKRVVFDTLGAGSLFGGISLKPEVMGHFAEAVVGSKICNFPQKIMVQIMAENPKVIISFWQEVSNRLSEYENRLRDNSAPAGELLLNELKRLKQLRQKSMFGLLNRPLVITHEELAKRSGLNRVTVTREMKHLRETDKITVNPKSGVIEIL